MDKKYIISVGAVLGGITVLLLLLMLLTMPNPKQVVGIQSDSVTSGTSSEIADKPKNDTPHFSNGTFIVGKDIQPGTYRTRESSLGCYWKRLSDLNGGIDSYAASDLTDYPAVVTINATDAAFSSSNCGTWTQDLSQITKTQTQFGGGTYIVGTDIQPGIYKSSAPIGCYWKRLADFYGNTDTFIDSDISKSQAVVQIDATDKGFSSVKCGTWTIAN